MPRHFASASSELPNPMHMTDQEIILLHYLVKHGQANVPPAKFVVQLASPLRSNDARESIAYLALYLPSLQTAVATALFAWTICTDTSLPEDVSTIIRAYLDELLRVGEDKTSAYALSLFYLAIQQKALRKQLNPEYKHRFAPSTASEPRDVRVFAARLACLFDQVDHDRLRFFLQYLPKVPTFPHAFKKNKRTKDVVQWITTYKHEHAPTSTVASFEQFQTDTLTSHAFATFPKNRTASEYTTWLVGAVTRDVPITTATVVPLLHLLAKKQHIQGLDTALTSVVGVQGSDLDKTMVIPLLNRWEKLHASTLEVLYRIISQMKDKTLAIAAGMYATYLFLREKQFAMAKAMCNEVSFWYASLPTIEKERLLAFIQHPSLASTTDPELQQILFFLSTNEQGGDL